MTEFKSILDATNNELVKLTQEFKTDLHKELVLGQTRYMCRYGTLSDGHETTGITNSQRFYSAKRSAWNLSNEIIRMRALAKQAQGELLEAKGKLELSTALHEQLKLESTVELKEQRLTELLVLVEDSLRQLDEYHRVINELKDEVRTKYPNGIEQAEQDNWTAVAQYKAFKKQLGFQEYLTTIPLEPETKARIGIENNCPEMTGWLLAQNDKTIKDKYDGNWIRFLEDTLNIQLGANNEQNVLGTIRKR